MRIIVTRLVAHGIIYRNTEKINVSKCFELKNNNFELHLFFHLRYNPLTILIKALLIFLF